MPVYGSACSLPLPHPSDEAAPGQVLFDVGNLAQKSISIRLHTRGLMFSIPEEQGSQPILHKEFSSKSWRHVAFTWDGQELQTYLDGQHISNTPVTPITLSAQSIPPLDARLGSSAKPDSRASRMYKGRLDEFVIVTRALTDREIARIYDLGKRRKSLAEMFDHR